MNIIPLIQPLTAVYIAVMGYNYDLVTHVFLSSCELTFPSLTSIEYTHLSRVSAICPPFSGYRIDSYTVSDKNRINIQVDRTMFTGLSGQIDIIFANQAGYTKLSDKEYIVCVDC